VRTNEREAALIGINPAARVTCQKPDGNSAAKLGSFSGCHPGKFRRGFRIAQVNKSESPYRHFKNINPQACEASVWSPNGTDDVIRFCVEYEGVMEDDLTAVEFLGHVRTLYKNWVVPGKVPGRCTRPWLSHNISNTVRVRDHEWEDVAREIYEHRHSYSGVSFISVTGDRDYPQAPFTSVYSPAEQAQMYPLMAQEWERVDMLVGKVRDYGFRDLWDAADLVLNLWGADRHPTEVQREWVVVCASLAERAFGGDLRKTTYCLKDRFNWELYRDLCASYTPVDYALMREETNGVKLQQEVACGSGGCEL
jgi:ribonucleoside-diphosphate reductase alpha chain